MSNEMELLQIEHLTAPQRALVGLVDSDLIDACQDIEGSVARQDREHAEKTAFDRDMHRIARAEIARRIAANEGTQLAHDYYVVELKVTDKIDHRIDVLRTLQPLVPADEFAKAVYLNQPEPEWKANSVKLAALARKYGGRVAEIVAAGLPRVVVGKPKLIITPREQTQRAA